jgi:hypothetical protein
MAINPPGIGSVDVRENNTLSMEIVTTRPSLTEILAVARQPGQLIGFYNGSTGLVELYTVDFSGIRYLKVL